MAEQIVVGLFESKGIAEDACNRLRTEGVPDSEVSLKLLREIGPVPTSVKAELAALTVDPLIWGDVRDTYVSYIKNGETAVLVRALTPEEAELAADILRMFEPMIVDVLKAARETQATPVLRKPATSSRE